MREQLVRVPIQESTMTSCSLRRLQELAAQPPSRCSAARSENAIRWAISWSGV